MSKKRKFNVISPIDGAVYIERDYADDQEIEEKLAAAAASRSLWKTSSIEERAQICLKAVEYLVSKAEEIGKEITVQMGRPLRYTPNEIKGGVQERAKYMIDIAESALKAVEIDSNRFITREPLGTVLVLAPWNYPYLTSINAIIPALMAGNTVVLKHSDQTPLTAERYQEAFDFAGLPKGVFNYLHIDHDQVAAVIQDARIDYIAFTGSVEGGEAVQSAIGKRFVSAGLELGGKDPAYVRADADVQNAVENCVDGAFFNSGQSCCGIERIYVDQSIYNDFVQQFIALTKSYILGDPLHLDTQLGPMARFSGVIEVKRQIEQAIKKGAVRNIDFQGQVHGNYLFPEVLTNVDHGMDIMKEETFGPVVGIMAVRSDEEAIELMNDSHYGLTASIWTNDLEKAVEIGNQLETGTVFMNRCDYLDPALAWTGVKNSGKGTTLSSVGYEVLTRPKSFHLKTI
jgi:acyl-CoA reductase-like NAD-dependent aldehyde dehydrogenase